MNKIPRWFPVVGLVGLLLLAGACRGAGRSAGIRAARSTSVIAPDRPPPAVPRPSAGPARAPSSDAAPAASPTASKLDLGGALQQAARRNPRLAAAREHWLAATQRPAQERALPDPLLSYTEMIEPIRTRSGPIERDLQVQQRIPFPGKLSAAGAIAEEKARVSRLEYDIALRDTVADVKVSYAELVYLHKALRIVEQNQAIARQLTEKGAALYGGAGEDRESDAVTLFDTLKAQSQLAQLSYDLITLRELLATEEARMAELLSAPAGSTLGAPTELTYRPLQASQEQLIEIGLRRRQEIEAALHKISAAEHAQRLARLSQVPDFTLGAKYSFIGEQGPGVPHSGDDAFGVTLGITLPIWGGKNAARIAEADHLKRAACLERRAEEDNLKARIAKVFFKLQNADRLVRLYKESLIPQAADAMQIAEQWRDTGRETYGRLLEAQSVWLNFQLAYQRALADQEQSIARLEQLVGVSLGRFRGREEQ